MAEAAVQRVPVSGSGTGAVHWLWCFLMRQPGLLRVVCKVLRRWPIIGQWAPVVARRDAVVEAFQRSATFSNTAHAPNLVAGVFSIGLQEGPRYRRERATLEAMLRTGTQLGRFSAVLARRQLEGLMAPGAPSTFDLVDDYLGPVIWRSMKRCFGPAGDALALGDSGASDPETVEKQLFEDLRHVASHLVVGGVATAAVQGRAEAAGAAVNRRVLAQHQLVRQAFEERLPQCPAAALHRNTVGLLWVSHPVAVQAGVHLMLELIGRPEHHARLRQQVAQAGRSAWLDPALRHRVRLLVLELLRFRPPFPVVIRDVPRSSTFNAGDDCPARVQSGQSLRLMVIGALFDPDAVERPDDFWPERPWRHDEDRYLVFGHGDRRCPGQEHALQMLVSMLIGLMMLPRPCRLAGRRALRYDGPATAHLQLVY